MFVDEVMVFGDGENDMEMLILVGWGVVMFNGFVCMLVVVNVIISSNDEDGVVRVIEKYIF